MGREALCRCRWGAEGADVKVQLEGGELILRGGMRRRVSVVDLRDVLPNGDQLTFRVGDEAVALTLGAGAAERWAKAIATPPPSLAKKLGIDAGTRVKVWGVVDDDNLEEALRTGSAAEKGNIHLVVGRVDTVSELQAMFENVGAELSAGLPLWIVYPKGPGQQVREAMVMDALRGRGLVDTKVAAVSARLTAIRCSRRKVS